VRFRDVDSGSVTIGGVDVRDVAQEDLRKAVVFAAQDAHLFNTTLRENIQLARRDADEADIWHALESAGAADWARSLPDGLDTFVGEDGGVISGGQRQRIALARALLADGRFLILDEPTAHLDAETARRVMAHIAAGARRPRRARHHPLRRRPRALRRGARAARRTHRADTAIVSVIGARSARRRRVAKAQNRGRRASD
jgi:ABC-type multidrug transport system fused ATPase/permease subunit